MTAAMFAGIKPAPGREGAAPTAIRRIGNADIVRDMSADPRKIRWLRATEAA